MRHFRPEITSDSTVVVFTGHRPSKKKPVLTIPWMQRRTGLAADEWHEFVDNIDLRENSGALDSRTEIAGLRKMANDIEFASDTRYRLKRLATAGLKKLNPDLVIVGGALGWDNAGLAAAVDLGLRVHLEMPFPGYNDRWPSDSFDKRMIHRLVDDPASKDTYSYTTEDHPKSIGQAMMARNAQMLSMAQKADDAIVLALWNGAESGGTYNTVQEAARRGMLIRNTWSSWCKYATRDDNKQKPNRSYKLSV